MLVNPLGVLLACNYWVNSSLFINTILTYLGNIKTSARDISSFIIHDIQVFLSPVAEQTMSNMAVAMRGVMQMCFVGFSILLELSTNG